MKARQRKMVDKGMAKARTRDSMQEVAKADPPGVDGLARQIIADPPLNRPRSRTWLPKDTDQAAFAAHDPRTCSAKYQRTLETDRRYLLEQFEYADLAARSSAWAASAPAAGSC